MVGGWGGVGRGGQQTMPASQQQPPAWLCICLLTVACWLACRYRNSTSNDLTYWGLDYPPLSGYQVRRHRRHAGWLAV